MFAYYLFPDSIFGTFAPVRLQGSISSHMPPFVGYTYIRLGNIPKYVSIYNFYMLMYF